MFFKAKLSPLLICFILLLMGTSTTTHAIGGGDLSYVEQEFIGAKDSLRGLLRNLNEKNCYEFAGIIEKELCDRILKHRRSWDKAANDFTVIKDEYDKRNSGGQTLFKHPNPKQWSGYSFKFKGKIDKIEDSKMKTVHSANEDVPHIDNDIDYKKYGLKIDDKTKSGKEFSGVGRFKMASYMASKIYSALYGSPNFDFSSKAGVQVATLGHVLSLMKKRNELVSKVAELDRKIEFITSQ